MILRFMAKRMGHPELARVLEELQRGGLQDRALSMLLSLAMIACPDLQSLYRAELMPDPVFGPVVVDKVKLTPMIVKVGPVSPENTGD